MALEELARFLFQALGIVRVYTKLRRPDAERVLPFTVRRGETVLDVARLVHQDVARTLKFARLWGSGAFDGQRWGRSTASPIATSWSCTRDSAIRAVRAA